MLQALLQVDLDLVIKYHIESHTNGQGLIEFSKLQLLNEWQIVHLKNDEPIESLILALMF